MSLHSGQRMHETGFSSSLTWVLYLGFCRWRAERPSDMLTSWNVDSALVGERLSSLMAAKDRLDPTATDAMARICAVQ